MLKHRVIPCLLLAGDGLVKTKQFKDPVYVGDPINALRIFNEKEVDELVLLDIRASVEDREPDLSMICEVASECFMPLAYGGGITTLEQAGRILRMGVEKIVVNTALQTHPEFVREAVKEFGSQAIIGSIDVRRKMLGRWGATILSGRKIIATNPDEQARYAEDLGVGEILLQSIDRDGLMSGYDLDLVRLVSQAVSVPVIACGGAGNLLDLQRAIVEGKASAVAAGSMFVFYGPHQAVLISYPEYNTLCELFGQS